MVTEAVLSIEFSALSARIEAVAVSTPPGAASAPTRTLIVTHAFWLAPKVSPSTHSPVSQLAPPLFSMLKGTPPDHDTVSCPPWVVDNPTFSTVTEYEITSPGKT